ncbi:hypothetical protein QQS21_012727 [Conoideocrella luteorostrata]|uniref:Protein kinase domain-containing protein n=1 Tax=Conoideocrella luteorostrata TaxID=1105319 RepID=A0AAJ0CF66_9HYPO|nr:hypothetical protein QQS21_012727 [Conoideocrella luteorostrata]
MASGRGSVIDLRSVTSKSKTQHSYAKSHAGVSTENFNSNRLKKHKPTLASIPQQDEPSLRENITSESVGAEPLWASYTKLYSLQFGASDYFIVAEEKIRKKNSNPEQNPLVIIKTFAGFAPHNSIPDIQRIKDKNFVPIRNIISVQSEITVAFEFMPLSLSEIAGNPLIDDIRLASLLGPIVDGLMYLDESCLEHTQLICSNILVDTAGNVKLWAQEHIQGGSARRKHVQSLRSIALQLVQGYVEEDGPDGPDRSKQCPNGVKFLAEMERALSVDSLRKV